MTKAEVIDVIKEVIEENLDDISAADVDPQKSMKDYGANSLDMIEVVSCSMRELKIKVPRSELAELQNIEALADKFMEYTDA
jgi:polyketide biosynthesis acyl carrier protein